MVVADLPLLPFRDQLLDGMQNGLAPCWCLFEPVGTIAYGGESVTGIALLPEGSPLVNSGARIQTELCVFLWCSIRACFPGSRSALIVLNLVLQDTCFSKNGYRHFRLKFQCIPFLAFSITLRFTRDSDC